MNLKIYQVDAFTSELFGGNPAAVCPLDQWLPDDLMQKVAMENNLSETAFFVKEDGVYHIRWFTPRIEVRLCGHATLASSHVLFNHLGYSGETIHFHSKSGHLEVSRKENFLVLDFPSDIFVPVTLPEGLTEALGQTASECYMGRTDYMLIFTSKEDIIKLHPDFDKLRILPVRGIIVTAPGEDNIDFVSRFFAPGAGIDEDPVTGSSHTTLIPYWSKRLEKNTLRAMQLSSRKGYLDCEYVGDRVWIGGECQTYLIGEIKVQ